MSDAQEAELTAAWNNLTDVQKVIFAGDAYKTGVIDAETYEALVRQVMDH